MPGGQRCGIDDDPTQHARGVLTHRRGKQALGPIHTEANIGVHGGKPRRLHMLEAGREGGFFARAHRRDARDSGRLCCMAGAIGTCVVDDHDVNSVRLGLEVVQEVRQCHGFVAARNEHGEFTYHVPNGQAAAVGCLQSRTYFPSEGGVGDPAQSGECAQ